MNKKTKKEKSRKKRKYVKNRFQVYNPKIKRWVKIDSKTGRIISVKSDGKPYKGVRRR